MGTGQFCTNPGVVVLPGGATSEAFVNAVAKRFREAPAGTMLGEVVRKSLASGIATLISGGATVVAGGKPKAGGAITHENTLLRVGGDAFLANPERLQTEAFGNESLFVVAKNAEQMVEIARHVEGNLTGCLYSHRGGQDDALYDRVAAVLRTRRGTAAERQDADGRGREPGHEPRRPVPGDRPSRLHGGWHPGFAAPLRHARMLRQRADTPAAVGA